MPRAKKTQISQAWAQPEAPACASKIAEDIYTTSLAFIRDEIEKIKAGTASESPHEPAARIGYLAKQAAAIGAELRKAEAAERAELGKLTETQIWAWLTAQTPDVRERIARDLVELDNPAAKKQRRSVFA